MEWSEYQLIQFERKKKSQKIRNQNCMKNLIGKKKYWHSVADTSYTHLAKIQLLCEGEDRKSEKSGNCELVNLIYICTHTFVTEKITSSIPYNSQEEVQ